MNLYIVDLFQTVFYNNGIPTFSDSLNKSEDKTRIKQIKKLIKDNNAFIIFCAMGEKWTAKNVNNFLNFFNIKHDHPRILFVLDALNDSSDNNTLQFTKWIKYSSQLMKIVVWEEEYGANKEINLNTNKFLYLMGKPFKRWRIKPLYQLYKEDWLDRADYSFKFSYSSYGHPERDVKDLTRQVLSEISDDDFETFVFKTAKDLDFSQHDWTGVGVPVDISLYQKTSISLISETTCDSTEPWFLSEKTWRTIANRHCFVPLFTEATFDYIETLGIDTFQKIMPLKKNYFYTKERDTLLSTDEVDQIVDYSLTNLKFLLENINDNRIYVEEKINQNYDCYKNLADEHRRNIPKKLEKYFYLSLSSIAYTSLRKIEDENISKTVIRHIWG